MDLHQLSEERSRAYHQVIATRLHRDGTLLEQARARVRAWLDASDTPPFYALEWQKVLSGEIDYIAAFLVDDSEIARELRQSSPFAGALSPTERWAIWRTVQRRGAAERDAR